MANVILKKEIIQSLNKGSFLFNPMATGLSIMTFKDVLGKLEIVSSREADLTYRPEGGLFFGCRIGEKKFELLDSGLLQSYVTSKDYWNKIKEKVKHDHTFIAGDSTSKFENVVFFEDIDEKGLRDTNSIAPIHIKLELGDGNEKDINLNEDLDLHLAGIMVNRVKDYEKEFNNSLSPRLRPSTLPGYRNMQRAWQKENPDSQDFYTTQLYLEDYKKNNNSLPDVSKLVINPKNWGFTLIFTDNGGKMKW